MQEYGTADTYIGRFVFGDQTDQWYHNHNHNRAQLLDISF